MQISEIDAFFEQQEEPTQSCMLAVKEFILTLDQDITMAWKYKLPFFIYRGRMFCYLWKDKKTKFPYLGVVEGRRIEHPLLIQGNRKRMKVISFDPQKDLPVREMEEILQQCLDFYRKGIIKTKF